MQYNLSGDTVSMNRFTFTSRPRSRSQKGLSSTRPISQPANQNSNFDAKSFVSTLSTIETRPKSVEIKSSIKNKVAMSQNGFTDVALENLAKSVQGKKLEKSKAKGKTESIKVMEEEEDKELTAQLQKELMQMKEQMKSLMEQDDSKDLKELSDYLSQLQARNEVEFPSNFNSMVSKMEERSRSGLNLNEIQDGFAEKVESRTTSPVISIAQEPLSNSQTGEIILENVHNDNIILSKSSSSISKPSSPADFFDLTRVHHTFLDNENIEDFVEVRYKQRERIQDILQQTEQADSDYANVLLELDEMKKHIRDIMTIDVPRNSEIDELSKYVEELHNKTDDDGQLITFPANFNEMVDQMHEETREDPDSRITFPVSLQSEEDVKTRKLKEQIHILDLELINKTKQAHESSALLLPSVRSVSEKSAKKNDKIALNIAHAKYGNKKLAPEEEIRVNAILGSDDAGATSPGNGYLPDEKENCRLHEIDNKLDDFVTLERANQIVVPETEEVPVDTVAELRIERDRARKKADVEEKLAKLQAWRMNTVPNQDIEKLPLHVLKQLISAAKMELDLVNIKIESSRRRMTDLNNNAVD